jgi:hypothetical protein
MQTKKFADKEATQRKIDYVHSVYSNYTKLPKASTLQSTKPSTNSIYPNQIPNSNSKNQPNLPQYQQLVEKEQQHLEQNQTTNAYSKEGFSN